MQLQQIDALAWVRGNPARFFSAGRAEAIPLLAYALNDVLELGRGECRICCHDGWWLIASDQDWLIHPEFSIRQLFENVVPAPEHGEHSLRAEVLVNAFASDVFTAAGDEHLVVRGEAPGTDMIARAVDSTWCKRLIAFRLAGKDECTTS
jgi:hypothetical protein